MLLARRRANFRQRPALRIRSANTALQFVNAVGLCSTFHVFREGLPSLWEAVVGQASPRWPRRSHHDAGIGLTWELKDVLPGRRQVYYGKLVKGRPVLVSLELFPAFYALVRGAQRGRDYIGEYRAGRLSQSAKRIMDCLIRESPQYTRSLRAECFMLEPSRTREFERAMAELQQGLWIVKTEERYEPSFSYRWDLLERWLPEATAAGRRLKRASALDQLLTRYLGAAVYSTPGLLARLFAVPRAEVASAVARLQRAGVVTTAAIEGQPGRWLVST
jgi:Winged helix DNA-binding domain